MLDLLLPYYLWFKAAHVVSVIVWLGGQCLLVAQLAGHHRVLVRQGNADLLGEVEQRCLRLVVNPAMLATLLLGAALFFLRGPETLGEVWFQAKLVLVLAMTALHGTIASTVAALRRDTVSATRIRVLQLAGFALTVAIVSLAVIK